MWEKLFEKMAEIWDRDNREYQRKVDIADAIVDRISGQHSLRSGKNAKNSLQSKG